MNAQAVLRRLAVGVTGIAIAAAVIPSAASAGSSSLNVTGPTSNLMGAPFDETISGVASGPADEVVAWEQFYKHSGCAATFAAESTRSFFNSTYGLTTWLARPVTKGQSYTVVAHFGARNKGVHGMCTYLINLSTGTTYAHGGIWWNNHT